MDPRMQPQTLAAYDPARYWDLRNKGIEDPDLYVYWLNTEEGMLISSHAQQYIIDEYNSRLKPPPKDDKGDDIKAVLEQNKMLIDRLDGLLEDNKELKNQLGKKPGGNK